MSIFDAGKICLFSKVEGRLTLEGNAVRSATIVRSWDWNGRHSDRVTTDDEGYFRFPAVHTRSIKPLLPAEITVGQELVAEVEGVDYVLWQGVKRDGENNSELDGSDFLIACELKSAERLVDDYRSPILTLCKVEKEL